MDVKGAEKQGASTLSMQLARMFWLNQDKTWKRKAAEVMITLQLEQKLTKEQIFEYYANQIDLGPARQLRIHGFGEAAQAYFGKDIRELTLAEAAMLAGLIQRPSYYNPYRHPDRACARRNIVLGLMRENGYITETAVRRRVQDARSSCAEGGVESTDAPYFVDLVNDDLQEKFSDHDFQANSYRVYTTLDMNLQRDAVEAVRIGHGGSGRQLAGARSARSTPKPQVALVAWIRTPREVKALIGGRNYGVSQLNRVLAKRQPGSIFKPFVYAAALNTALEGREPRRSRRSPRSWTSRPRSGSTASRTSPTTSSEEFHGTVTLRQALAEVDEHPHREVRRDGRATARWSSWPEAPGMNRTSSATPAVALGAYEVTPLEIAGAYTVFSNGGI